VKAGTLAEAAVGAHLQITTVTLDEDDAAWLAAVGLHVGEGIVVLRRAAFGGPLHVRTRAGGEFAIAREVARSIQVQSEGAAT
jgi:ferrous iron transport protein A